LGNIIIIDCLFKGSSMLSNITCTNDPVVSLSILRKGNSRKSNPHKKEGLQQKGQSP
jgi:hypothetical protein